MKAVITSTPSANSAACTMCAPRSPSPSRIASAQPPANAAPNTSAPIRMAALMTVMTLGQTIWREEEAGAFMGLDPWSLRGAISPKRSPGARPNGAKKPIACYSWAQQTSSKIGTSDVRNPPDHGCSAGRDEPAVAGLGDAVCDPAVRRDQHGALPPSLRAGLRRPLG